MTGWCKFLPFLEDQTFRYLQFSPFLMVKGAVYFCKYLCKSKYTYFKNKRMHLFGVRCATCAEIRGFLSVLTSHTQFVGVEIKKITKSYQICHLIQGASKYFCISLTVQNIWFFRPTHPLNRTLKMYDHREVSETSVCLDKCLYISPVTTC